MTDDSIEPKQYRKKPVVISASVWYKLGDHPEVKSYDNAPYIVHTFAIGKENPNICFHCSHHIREHGWVGTLEGGHIVCVGDWIIKGVKGEFYPCKPDIFASTYEPVDALYTSPSERLILTDEEIRTAWDSEMWSDSYDDARRAVAKAQLALSLIHI